MSLGFGPLGQGPVADSSERLSSYIIRTSQLGGSALLQALLENPATAATAQFQLTDVSGYIQAVADLRTYQVFQNVIIDASLIVDGAIHTSQVQSSRLSTGYAECAITTAQVQITAAEATTRENSTFGSITTAQTQTVVVRGNSYVKEDNVGGSGIYYGPWGAPFVLPFAKEYEIVNGKRRKKVRRIQVAVKFSKAERWKRTYYNLGKLSQDVQVTAGNLKELQSIHNNKPKITVNASTLRLIKTVAPHVDISNFTVVESKKKFVDITNLLEKHVLVETGTINQTNYKIDARVIFDSTSFKVTVKLPNKIKVDA